MVPGPEAIPPAAQPAEQINQGWHGPPPATDTGHWQLNSREDDSGTRSATLVFDGECAFCSSCADWVARRWPDRGPEAIAWQVLGADGLTRCGLTEDLAMTSAWWVEADGELFGAEQAIGQALLACRRPWCWLGTLVLNPPGCWLARLLYRWIARNRHRLPGGTPACTVDSGR